MRPGWKVGKYSTTRREVGAISMGTSYGTVSQGGHTASCSALGIILNGFGSHEAAQKALEAEVEKRLEAALRALSGADALGPDASGTAEDAARLAREWKAAVADNAALVEALTKTRDELDEMVGIRAGEALRVVCRQPHPGAALLGRHRKALARARNEALEEAATWHDANGDKERAWLDVNETKLNRPTAEAHRSFLECHRSSAIRIRALKTQEAT